MKNINILIRYLIVFISFIINLYTGKTQEVLDVLPEEGRNELFHSYLMDLVDSLSAKRKAAVDTALTSQEKMETRQQKLREDYLMLIGDLPEKTELNDSVVGTIERDGYNIDKVYYESRPNHHVTANFYYPVTGGGPFPGILVTCGHYPVAKAINLYQDLCIDLVKSGFAVLIVDPICQGERNQIINPENGELYYSNQSGTKAHSRLDVGATLVGSAIMAYELWDNYRSIDYLYTRTEVDTSKIGCTGSSGGGAQATYLVAFDQRIKVAAVNSYIMNEPTLFKTIGPQTGSQNLSYEGLYEIDHPEYIAMFAPKPFMILAGTQDFFDINGTHETYAEAQKIYDILGVPDNLGYFEYNDGHGYSQPKREEAVKWFRTWFYDDNSSYTESPLQIILQYDSLLVTETGQVYTNFEDEKVVQDFNLELALNYAEQRANFWSTQTKDSCLNKVKDLIKLDTNYNTPHVEITESITRQGYTIEKIKLTDNNLTPVTGLMFVPDDATSETPAVVYVDGRGKSTDAADGGLIEQVYVDSGKAVFAIDVRGFGETTDNPAKNESKHGNNEHRNSVISLYVGKTLIGQRVEDIMKATGYLFTRSDIDTTSVSIVGIDRAGTAVLHAAALNPEYNEVIIRKWTDTTWITVVNDPTVLNNMTHVVPSALKYYDLPDLINAIAPVPVKYMAEPEIISGINESDMPENVNHMLGQNYPNPFNESTSIVYSIPSSGSVLLKVFDNLGREVRVLVDNYQHQGRYKVKMEALDIKPSVYFYQLLLNGKILDTRKMIVL